jgi:MFS family permease
LKGSKDRKEGGEIRPACAFLKNAQAGFLFAMLFRNFCKTIKDMHPDLKIVVASVFLFALGYSSVISYIPLLLRKLGATNSQIGMVYSVITGSASISALLGGYLLSRVDLKKYAIVASLIIAPFALIFYFATDWRHGLIAGLIDGISYASAPAFSMIVYYRSKKGALGYNFSVYSSAFSAGAAIAPAIGGYLARNYGIRTPFIFSFIMLVLSSLILIFLRPESVKPENIGFRDSFKAIFEEKSFIRVLVVFMVLILFETAYDPFVSVYLKEVHGFNFEQIGLLVSAVFLINFIASPIIGMIADKNGSSFALGITLVGYALSLAFLAKAESRIILLASVAGIGVFKQIYTLSTISASRNTGKLPPHIAYANLHFLRTSLSVMGPVIGGYLANISIRAVFWATAATYLVFGLSSLFYFSKSRRII